MIYFQIQPPETTRHQIFIFYLEFACTLSSILLYMVIYSLENTIKSSPTKLNCWKKILV